MAHPHSRVQGRAIRRRIMEVISEPDAPRDVRGIARMIDRSYVTTYKHLRWLRDEGFVSMPAGRRFAIRPLVKFGVGVIRK